MFLSDNNLFRVELANGLLFLRHGSGHVLHSPVEGHWSISVDWQDNAPGCWQHGVIEQVEKINSEWHLSGIVQLPQGKCFCRDILRWHDSGLLEIRRRWRYCGSWQPGAPGNRWERLPADAGPFPAQLRCETAECQG